MTTNVLLASDMPGERICFRNLFVGDGLLEYGKKPDQKRWISEPVHPVQDLSSVSPRARLYKPKRHTITIFFKTGKRLALGQ